MLKNIGLVMAGGALGSALRYVISLAFLKMTLPVGTLTANMLGCLILGIVLGLAETRFSSMLEFPHTMKLLLVVGFLGALTTFSTFEMESMLMVKNGDFIRALSYVLLSVGLGFTVIWFAFSWSRWFFDQPKWN